MNLYRNVALALGLACAGCSSTSSSWQTDLAALQTAVPVVEAALATYAATNTPAITKAEADLNAALAALVASPTPTSAATVLADLQAVASALPANVISPAHQAEIAAAVALARLVVSGVPSS